MNSYTAVVPSRNSYQFSVIPAGLRTWLTRAVVAFPRDATSKRAGARTERFLRCEERCYVLVGLTRLQVFAGTIARLRVAALLRVTARDRARARETVSVCVVVCEREILKPSGERERKAPASTEDGGD